MKRRYTGLNGRIVALDLSKVEAVLDEGDGEVHLFTSGDWYKIREPIDDVLRDWEAS
ncbi:hypothetical protein U1769_17965 [Sphingomonas sp. ZT3P38]|uniref:hypothetical protein n=1 Tax=Parasphingomonas zepuensis TaxID=3096161 RepID=UPI002FCBA4DF